MQDLKHICNIELKKTIGKSGIADKDVGGFHFNPNHRMDCY